MKTYIRFGFIAIFLLVGCANDASHDQGKVTRVSSSPVAVAEKHSKPISISGLENKTSSPPNHLSLKQIMADPDWIGRPPQNADWSVTGNSLIFEQKKLGKVSKTLFTATITNASEFTQVTNKHKHLHLADEKVYSHTGEWLAWTYGESLFVKQGTRPLKILRQGPKYQHLTWTIDSQLLVRIDNKILKIDPISGAETIVLQWQFADKPQALEPVNDYLSSEQLKLIQYLQKKRNNTSRVEKNKTLLRNQNAAYSPNTLYFSKNHRLVNVSVSPALNYAIVVTTENRAYRSEQDIMPHYIQQNAGVANISVRQKVADASADNHLLWLVDLTSQSAQKLSFVSLPGYNDDALADVKRENAKRKGESYENNRLPRPITLMSAWGSNSEPVKWHRSGTQVALMLEAWDNKDRWITTVNFATKQLITQHRLSDPAWINYAFNTFGWLHNSYSLYYLSEETGYSHLYVKPINGVRKALTKGQFIVDNITASNDDNYLYFTANKTHPGIYEVYRVGVDNAVTEQLTSLNGVTNYVLNNNETHLLLTHSQLDKPPELYIRGLQQVSEAQQITHTVSDAFTSIGWLRPKIIAIPSSNTEQAIYARLYLPANASNGNARKAVIFNHGAGYLQNAHYGWSRYFREYMFHNFLTQQGYVVLDMDYRASKGYGRNWRTAIYRHMGKAEIEDLRDGVNWLVNNANVNRDRIGTYGGSYGGFLTFMALFTAPDLFQAGAALRPVSDWAHYNAPYTSNILNLPAIDPIAYQRSSPIYFAEGLSVPLLINAPMVDNNVFFSDVVRLVQRLIELEKTSLFETAIYPVESHGFTEPSSWLDEYTRIYALFEENL